MPCPAVRHGMPASWRPDLSQGGRARDKLGEVTRTPRAAPTLPCCSRGPDTPPCAPSSATTDPAPKPSPATPQPPTPPPDTAAARNSPSGRANRLALVASPNSSRSHVAPATERERHDPQEQGDGECARRGTQVTHREPVFFSWLRRADRSTLAAFVRQDWVIEFRTAMWGGALSGQGGSAGEFHRAAHRPPAREVGCSDSDL